MPVNIRVRKKSVLLRLPTDLFKRMEKQRRLEKRERSEFIRRVLDRYLLEQEFKGSKPESEVTAATQDSLSANEKLHQLLRNS